MSYFPSSSSAAGLNNPFSTDPSNPRNRFPDISAQQEPHWLQPSSQPAYSAAPPQNYGQPQPQSGIYPMQSPPAYQQQQPQQQTIYASAPNGYGQSPFSGQLSPPAVPNQPFQLSSQYGQQFMGQATPQSMGYQPTGLYQQQTVPQQQQPANQLPGYLAQFDPFSAIGQGWDGQPQPQQQFQQQQQQQQQSYQGSTQTTHVSPSGQPHPRDYIRTHKSELESWDTYSWKQALGTFEALKDAWEARKKELEARLRQMQMQSSYAGYGYAQEANRLNLLLKDANSNFDSVAASTFQMNEVLTGYRYSYDQASKRRVRESCNAALNGLPDWPGPY